MRELYFENHHMDCIGRSENKYNLYVADKADPELKVIGHISYTTLDDSCNELHIDFIEVKEELRGQGIGKALYRKLYELNKDYRFIRAGYYSDNGSHLRKWFEKHVLNNTEGNQ